MEPRRRNLEHEAVLKCTEDLVTAVQNCIVRFTSKCLSKRLISEELIDFTLTTGRTDAEKAMKLVKSVCDAIKNDPSRFDTLINVLKEFSHLESEVESLQKALSNASQPPPCVSSSSPEKDGILYGPPSALAQTFGDASQLQIPGSSPENDSPLMVVPLRPPSAGESAMEIEVSQGSVLGSEEVSSCTIPQVVSYIKNVKNVRAFGVLLGIESGKLDEIERSSSIIDTRTVQIVREWFKSLPENMDVPDRWEELGKVLLQPAVDEPGIAIKLKPHLRRGSSVDSAISVFSNRSDSFSSPRSPSSFQMSYIESIGNNQECSKANVLNCITPYSEWYEIGLYLNLPENELDVIGRYPVADQKSHLVELWYRQGYGFSWAKLQEALLRYLHKGLGTTGMGSIRTHLPTTPEDTSYLTNPTTLYGQDELKKKKEELQYAFEEIQENIMEILEQEKVLFKKFKRAISCFPAHVQLNSFRNFKTVSGDVEFEDIFSSWNQDVVWSFLDFTLLEGIVKRYGSIALKDSMKEYSTKLQDFRKRTLVSRLMNLWTDPNLPKEYEKCKTLILDLRVKADECTLEKLEWLRKHSCNKFLKGIPLSEAALVLFRLKPGCVCVTWIVRSDVVQNVRSALVQCVINGEYFKENNIISVMLDGEPFMSMERSLILASVEGDIKRVDQLIDSWNHRNHDINETDLNGKTALMRAAANGHESVVCSLLETGDRIDTNYQTEDTQWSALFFANENGHDGVVKLLLEYGADINLKSKDGELATDVDLMKKTFGWGVKIKKAIVSRGKATLNLAKKFSPLKKKLLSLCEIGDVEGIRSLLKGGSVDVNVKDASHKNRTPLMWACKYGYYEVVELLLQHGADIKLASTKGKTALYIACSNNFVRIAYRLLRSGADSNVVDKKLNYTPLMYISDMEHMEPMARALLKHGASVEVADDKNGWTPLIQACHYGRKELVELYLDRRAEVNRTADRGWTALMAAARTDKGEIVKLLLDRGAYMDMKMRDAKKVTGEPALHIASYKGSASVVPVLIQQGADPNVTNKAGLSALMIATNRKEIRIVDALCQSPTINLDLQQESTGLTALLLAAKNGYVEVFKKLLDYGASEEVTISGQTISVRDVALLFKKKAIIAQLEKHKLEAFQLREQRTEDILGVDQPALELTEEGQMVGEGKEVQHLVAEKEGTCASALDHNITSVVSVKESVESVTPGYAALGEMDKPYLGELLAIGDSSRVATDPIHKIPEQAGPQAATEVSTTHPATDPTTHSVTDTTAQVATANPADTAESDHVHDEFEGEPKIEASAHQSGESSRDGVNDSSSETSSLFEAEVVDQDEIFRQQTETQHNRDKSSKTTAKRKYFGKKGVGLILRNCFDKFDDSWRDYLLEISQENTGKGVQSPIEDYQNQQNISRSVA